MRLLRRIVSSFAVACTTIVALTFTPALHAAEKTNFSIAWTIYVGWMPWDYMSKTGIMKKWADKYGITVDIVQLNDYVESINQYTAGKFDGCTMTNMDALTIPAAGGVDTTALIIGDFSNGNDGVVLKGAGKKLADIKGQKVNLVELSVSHYLLARALESVKLAEKDIKVVNTSDADMVAAFGAKDVTAAVTWNPLLTTIKSQPNVSVVFDSSHIPGEIIDTLMVNSQTLKDNPKFGKAVVGAWFETMQLMSAASEAGKAAREMMAKASGTDLADFDSQLKTTRMFYSANDAVMFTRGDELPKTMEQVARFSFEHGLLGAGAKSAEAVGIAFPGGKSFGDAKNIKLRFDERYMQMVTEGKL